MCVYLKKLCASFKTALSNIKPMDVQLASSMDSRTFVERGVTSTPQALFHRGTSDGHVFWGLSDQCFDI